MNKKKVQIVILVLLMAWYGLFFMEKIDLTVIDLGRHIKNGEMILNGQFEVLNTNFYSYTEPDNIFINHHWGSGVIFYLIWKLFGFTGLSIFYLLISLATFYIFFKIAWHEVGYKLSLLLSVLLIPLMAARTEIRPEGLSYFFIALFFWVLWSWYKKKIDDKWLFALIPLSLIWINLHIYFIFGLFFIGLFLVNDLVKNRKFNKKISLVLGLSTLASLINPFGVKGLFFPFNIFKEYGYQVVENKSVWFLENWGFNNPDLRLFEISLGILILSFILLLIRNRKKLSFIYTVLAVVWGVLGFMAIRNFTLFGFFALLVIGYNLRWSKLKVKKWSFGLVVFLSLILLIISFSIYKVKLPLQEYRFGFGLIQGNNESIKFFKEQNLQGNIFNNYDLGGYLIFHLFPERRVFTDNRPEAYSVSHFQGSYIPAQLNNETWQNLNDVYNFNIIYFSHRDYTNWGQNFLIERVKDNNWAVIYVDSFNILFLKRNEINQSLISQFEIPNSVFGL